MSTGVNTRHLTALAPPGELVDWRLALSYEAVAGAGVLDALPGTSAQLAEKCGLDELALRALLEVLVAWELLVVDDAGRYTGGPAELGAQESAALAQHGVWIRRWAALAGPRLRERTAQSPLAPERPPTAVGLALLKEASRLGVGEVVDVCMSTLPGAGRVLDLGGGHGAYALELRRRGCMVTMQDLPGVIEIASGDGALPAAGVELVAADMFERLAPGPFDLVLCATVTNMFDAQKNRDLLKRIRSVLAPGGALAIVSYLRDHGPVGAVFGVQMLVATPGGDAHGEADYRQWLTEAGYGDVEVADIETPPLSVVVARY
ncbi:methyltransferase [Phytoactinopolyspora mesophila]|uniref:Methyltransferase domain-containing protein n=1 Tax=Phytoactinopolyspora mesophila TaxID=2650750 RepID=A0A7K3LXY6_9ACTN|nr:methyltransferase [Phytoactinopolyspora mesophila]NDL55840.1 methyltransferase domain-containing protein [Phytoactinopolyspora mesophila]